MNTWPGTRPVTKGVEETPQTIDTFMTDVPGGGQLKGGKCPVFPRGPHRATGDVSEGPSESSANIEDSDADFQKRLPQLERFYEQFAASAQLPQRKGASASDWALSMARSYRRFSNWKRRRGRLRQGLPVQAEGVSSFSGAGGLGCHAHEHGYSSHTDDSGYEGGYETDADESSLSEWESVPKPLRQKRKFDAMMQNLTHLTMRLSVSEDEDFVEAEPEEMAPDPPLKSLRTPRALGTEAKSLRLSFDAAPISRPPVPTFLGFESVAETGSTFPFMPMPQASGPSTSTFASYRTS